MRLQADELGQLVAPIALYPDALVAQILAASTYGPQVIEAEVFTRRNVGIPPQELAQIVDTQPWDPSVKALTAFPAVLSNLSSNFTWTTKLGDVYYNQPQDVMAAVQAMRQRAYAAGTLRSTQQESVGYQPGYIVIQPVNPEVVYVPVYNPWARLWRARSRVCGICSYSATGRHRGDCTPLVLPSALQWVHSAIRLGLQSLEQRTGTPIPSSTTTQRMSLMGTTVVVIAGDTSTAADRVVITGITGPLVDTTATTAAADIADRTVITEVATGIARVRHWNWWLWRTRRQWV